MPYANIILVKATESKRPVHIWQDEVNTCLKYTVKILIEFMQLSTQYSVRQQTFGFHRSSVKSQDKFVEIRIHSSSAVIFFRFVLYAEDEDKAFANAAMNLRVS